MRPRYDVLVAIACAVWMLHLTPFVQASVINRLMVFTPVAMAANLGVPWLFTKVRDRKTRSSFLPLVTLELIFMLQSLVRAVVMVLNDGAPLTFIGSQWLQTSGSLALLVFLSVAPMACALIVIRKQEMALRRASLTDSMTGWMNRRALHDIATRELKRSLGTAAPLSFLIFDIDHFKRINDQYGHAVGDQAICHVTALASQALRGYDDQFRIGGEEFTVLFCGHDEEQTRNAGERVRRIVESTPLKTGELCIPITISLGVATSSAGTSSWESLLGKADAALYLAKQAGRNRLCVHGEIPPGQPEAAVIAMPVS